MRGTRTKIESHENKVHLLFIQDITARAKVKRELLFKQDNFLAVQKRCMKNLI